jgi:hypothetical protein
MEERAWQMVENEEGEPWSYSPETRASYEVALGRFILAFNDVDDLVTKLIRLVLWKLGRDDLFGRCVEKDFAHKPIRAGPLEELPPKGLASPVRPSSF